MTHKALIFIFLVASMTICAQPREISVNDLPCKPGAGSGNNFIGYGFAESSDLSIARNKAMLQATRELSAAMRSHMQTVSELYVSGSSSVQTQTFNNIIAETVNETLEDPSITCQKHETAKGKTRYYVALEVTKEKVLNTVESKATTSHSGEVDFDKARFEEIFSKETAPAKK